MLRIGKIPENVLKRSVLKQIGRRREEIITSIGPGEDCAALKLEEDELLVTSINSVTITDVDSVYFVVNNAVNDIASSFARPVAIMISILLPENYEEKDLKKIVSRVEEVAKSLSVQVMGACTEVVGAVVKPVITVCGYGRICRDKYISTKGAKPGDDVIISKWIGLEGTSVIARQKEDILKQKFSPAFVDEAIDFSKYMSVFKETELLSDYSIHSMHNIGEGGAFGALWEFAEASGCGLEIDLLKLPLKQHTVEICEEFGINPYELISNGSLIIAAENGEDIVRQLEKNDINAIVVGKVTEGNDRVVINGDEKRFLEPAKKDEIYKII